MIEMQETLDGGDYCLIGDSILLDRRDDGILLDNSIKTICYILLFGGNLEGNTEIDRKPRGVLYPDYWGNVDFLNDETQQFNSEFEKQLAHTPINSGNLIEFEGAAEVDLQRLVTQGLVQSVDADAIIEDVGKLRIDITVKQPSQTEPETFSFVWNETLQKVELL